VTVISGLARGIDAAAHRGVRLAQRAAPGAAVAVVGNGLDIAYPRQNSELWAWVGEHGALISEWPPGTVPEAWRFPLRNRVIAALSERVIVVESRARGGSLITVRDALDRGIDVMAVPGSIRSRSSEGTNWLINQGAGVVTSVDDVLVALGLDHSRQSLACDSEQPALAGIEASVLQRCAERPSTIDMLAADLCIPISQIAAILAMLETSGVLIDSGGWFESSSSRLGPVARAAAEVVRPGSLAT
jgi:DNA processing protein